jgi:hypothetical protein
MGILYRRLISNKSTFQTFNHFIDIESSNDLDNLEVSNVYSKPGT